MGRNIASCGGHPLLERESEHETTEKYVLQVADKPCAGALILVDGHQIPNRVVVLHEIEELVPLGVGCDREGDIEPPVVVLLVELSSGLFLVLRVLNQLRVGLTEGQPLLVLVPVVVNVLNKDSLLLSEVPLLLLLLFFSGLDNFLGCFRLNFLFGFTLSA